MYSKNREQDLKTSSFERVPDYRGFGPERFHCTCRSSQLTYFSHYK